ncbi:hypothetical protein [Amycolatopsis sp. H20-H5]|uniref:hypothetical protein n=1 Tax=Amycolatopsis sp. H20-H5 TaxID=3046309 RepID=UPI002DBE89DF|nr:hypothetical protein [Amycolatopsis sp. H20-H5]MEC3980842.1 hypothetical protein [Amycolatopsis sp. H20-H5]
MFVRIGHHRRYTANHAWHADVLGQKFFVKANPAIAEARAETAGYRVLAEHYPVPALLAHGRAGRWYVHVYRRQPGVGPGRGLLLDLITTAENTGRYGELDAAAADILGHYRRVITATVRRRTPHELVQKLYGDRARPGGRLDAYYRTGRLWLTGPDGTPVGTDDLAGTTLLFNRVEHRLDLPAVLDDLRSEFASGRSVWSVVTQGDPTAFNLGWTSQNGPFWFDYDTGGHNAIAGEFAVALVDLLLHGARLTPAMHPDAYADHPAALATAPSGPGATLHQVRTGLIEADIHHRASPARRWLAALYLRDLVVPVAADLGIDNVAGWLRPYLLLRLLGVYHPADLTAADALVLLAAITHVQNPHLELETLLDLTAPVEATP